MYDPCASDAVIRNDVGGGGGCVGRQRSASDVNSRASISPRGVKVRSRRETRRTIDPVASWMKTRSLLIRRRIRRGRLTADDQCLALRLGTRRRWRGGSWSSTGATARATQPGRRAGSSRARSIEEKAGASQELERRPTEARPSRPTCSATFVLTRARLAESRTERRSSETKRRQESEAIVGVQRSLAE
jgi:hypothetical protein